MAIRHTIINGSQKVWLARVAYQGRRRAKVCRTKRSLVGVGFLAIITGWRFSTAFADVVELKTGQRVEGTLKQATPASVSIEVGGQTITFEGEKVRAIYFGTAPACSAHHRNTG